VFVITGTTTGTGFVAAKTAALLGGEVVMLNRSSSRVTDMLQKLKKEAPDAKLVTIECDLQDFASVKKAAQEIKSTYSKIYCLANNAGIMATPDKATKDGYDAQMQTNHFSHFLLTAELLPLLEKEATETGDARIVSHSSGARNMTKNRRLEEQYFTKNGGNLGGDDGSFMSFSGPRYERYNQTKLANAVFNQGLHNKLVAKNSKVRAVCCDPGLSYTNLSEGVPMGKVEGFVIGLLLPRLAQTPEDGTMGLLLAMMGPDSKSGNHYGPNMWKGIPIPVKLQSYETDTESIDMLWRTSEEATGVTFSM
jgi:NAD(P)-dependent dehydrogenase (short-subunit alcohol dehydrogenase family)